MTIQKWEKDLSQWIPSHNVKLNESLKKYTMTKLGGQADVLVLPETEEQAVAVVKYAAHNQIPLLMLGNGSNMVVRDGGVRGIVLHFALLNAIRIEGTTAYAQAGALIKDVSKRVAEQSLSG
ncbi:MAG: FAD-binding protein, partial [Solibacillus isronensis]